MSKYTPIMKIYAINSNDYDQNYVYIGLTSNTLKKTLRNFEIQYKRYNDNKTKKFLSAFNVIAHKNVNIELLEEYPLPIGNKADIHERVKYFKDLNGGNCVNNVIKPERISGETIVTCDLCFSKIRMDGLHAHRKTMKCIDQTNIVNMIRNKYKKV